MKKEFFKGNRMKFCSDMKKGSVAVFFSGNEIRKTNDEFFPFYANRNFLYLSGIEQKETVLLLQKEADGNIKETLFILEADWLQERWTGKRLKGEEASELSGVENIKFTKEFNSYIHTLMTNGNYGFLYLDLFKIDNGDYDTPAHLFAQKVNLQYPYIQAENANILVRRLRTIKQSCEIEAMRRAEQITGEGITAMMKNSKPGMCEYQYKAIFDYVLGQYGPQGPAFPSIISAGKNNFCIHYYTYSGQAMDGDMILNDVGACYDGLMNDVSRAFPCNGKFTERQKILYECALQTSNYMFSIIKPGMKMADVDLTARKYNFEMMKNAGILSNYEEIGNYMWHGGAHHVGYDVHDAIGTVEHIAPGMVFCVDIGIYHEDWGIGFRIEDNCLVTEDGCENLSAAIPRTIHEIENLIGNHC
ncbi:aminopeptidase P N-terminal domain-containing protein [Lachnoclostridium sp.]|uniref:aminopeptidase P N-terminal domain-containing protein n=1 Tax=Lachnoclostridium sp. TaxID=2028282 RepID=UPI0028A12C19|nr:aminopeptidase P N-terminal domain-containing protein [Lachnoclostridium sp.]